MDLRSLGRAANAALLLVVFCAGRPACAAKQGAAHGISGAEVLRLTQQYVNAAPKRYVGSAGHAAAENFIKSHFQPEAAKGNLVTDEFYARTPIGMVTMRNFIAKFPG